MYRDANALPNRLIVDQCTILSALSILNTARVSATVAMVDRASPTIRMMAWGMADCRGEREKR